VPTTQLGRSYIRVEKLEVLEVQTSWDLWVVMFRSGKMDTLTAVTKIGFKAR